MNGVEAYDKWNKIGGKLMCNGNGVFIDGFGLLCWNNTNRKKISINDIAYGDWKVEEPLMSLKDAIEKSRNGEVIRIKWDGSKETFNRQNSLISIEDAIQNVWKPVI